MFKALAITYLATLIIFLLVDSIWLTQYAGPTFRTQIPHLMAEKMVPTPAIVFYLLYMAGTLFFVTFHRYSDPQQLLQSFAVGFGFGLICYATFDMTSASVFKSYPISLAIADSLWGGFVTGISGVFSIKLYAFLSQA
jgi:uncharacterized membrane protein